MQSFPGNPRYAKRNRDILKRYDAGDTLAHIGALHGMTRQRVCQIVAQAGHTKRRGWRHAELLSQVAALYNREWTITRIARVLGKSSAQVRHHLIQSGYLPTLALKVYGLPRSHYEQLCRRLPQDQRVQRGYQNHRTNALRQHHAWEFNLASWWQVWHHSGHWSEAVSLVGPGNGYGMTRRSPAKPWSPGNVRIVPMRAIRKAYPQKLRAHKPCPRHRLYGMSATGFAQFKCNVLNARSVMSAYNLARNIALRYDKGWAITLADWWELWRRSGHWSQRGSRGYVMRRKDTRRGWSPSNVQIVRASAHRNPR